MQRIPPSSIYGAATNGGQLYSNGPLSTGGPLAAVPNPSRKPRTTTLEKIARSFTVGRLLGKGGSAEVYLVRKNASASVYAMKVTVKNNYRGEHTGIPIRELALLTELNAYSFPFVAQVMVAFQDHNCLYTIMDFAQRGDLYTLMEEHADAGTTMSCDTIRFFLAEIVCAVGMIHSLGYLHRDITPANILIGTDGHILVADLGTAIRPENIDNFNNWAGTLTYISPECTYGNGEPYDHAIDWWSVGVIAFEALTGRSVFGERLENRGPEAVLAAVRQNTFLLSRPKSRSQEEEYAYHLVKCLTESEPGKRLGAKFWREELHDMYGVRTRVLHGRNFGDANAAFPSEVISQPFFQLRGNGSTIAGMDKETILNKRLVPPFNSRHLAYDDASYFPLEPKHANVRFAGFGNPNDLQLASARVNEFAGFEYR